MTMTKVQIITTPSGDELVVLLRADYDALVAASVTEEIDIEAEDLDDLAIAEARMAEFVAAGALKLPPEVCAGLLRDESLIKALRKWRGIKQGELAAKAGLAQGYLSDIESRRKKGTETTLRAIAAALDAPPEWLVTAKR
jgi:DNA-binding XRE family transcriptional regulator